jgi:hypothetical protein
LRLCSANSHYFSRNARRYLRALACAIALRIPLAT